MLKKVVFVGLSGGVDSSVSAAILKNFTAKNYKKIFGVSAPDGFDGFEVVGVFIKTWHPDFLPCNEEEERRDAMRVAACLDIPFLTFDLEKEYKKGVADYMISEYKHGRTPNPDVMCNKEIKFGAFLKKAISMGADYVATGHYSKLKDGRMFKAVDEKKDQSYFLWTLSKKQVDKVIFPVGAMKKNQVRKLARKYGLPVANKKDSQGICFLGDVDMKDFLNHYIKHKPGNVLNISGEVIGIHRGAVFYTIGERHGFTINKKSPSECRYYVISKDLIKNTITVSSSMVSSDNLVGKSSFDLYQCNWINEKPKKETTYDAQVRYHGEMIKCAVNLISKDTAKIFFHDKLLVASGQSVVLYEGEMVLGGGVVS